MAFTKFRPRGDIKTNWEFKNPILARREIGVEWEQEIGKGNIKIKFGNGITAWNSLDYAVVDDITYKIIKVIATISEENPVLNAGETLDVLLGKIKKKFTYLENYIGDVKSLTNIFLPENIKTVAQALQNLIDNKIDNTKKYNGVDSTSTDLVPTANAVRIVNEKTENNKTAITTLNRDLRFDYSSVNGDDALKDYFNAMPDRSIRCLYNYAGLEYTYIISKKDARYGNILCISSNNIGSSVALKTMSIADGNWLGWVSYTSTSDFTDIMCAVSTIANTAVKIPGAPTTGSWSVVPIDHSTTINCLETILWQGDGWYIYSTVAQQALVKFTKLPTGK